jgi:hypothetical protein
MTMLLRLIVRRTIQLDDHPRGNADKIGDITAYGHLTPEFGADPAITQAAPQDRFRERHFATQAARLGKLTIGNAADHGSTLIWPCRATFSRLREKVCHPHPGEKTSNRPVGGEIVDVIDEAARGEQRDDLRRGLRGGLFVSPDD